MINQYEEDDFLKEVKSARTVIRMYNKILDLEERLERASKYEKLYNDLINDSINSSWKEIGTIFNLVLNNHIEITPIEQYIEE